MLEKEVFKHATKLFDTKPEDVAIEVNHLTKDYGKGRGIFDISFIIPKGKTFGYCGTNGAGKTTTIRHIMGFLKPDSGFVKVNGLDAWKDSEEIKKFIGYLPGEIAFPPLESGSDFLKAQAELINLKDMSRAEKIVNALQLDPTANLKRMSKGMKQKTALVASFMHSPDIILLDEPTTGLDPLMRDAFINIIREEKARGATIMMSNHMFDELEETCDYVAFIKDGRIIDIVDMEELHNRPFREYHITFDKDDDYKSIKVNHSEIVLSDEAHHTFLIRVPNEHVDDMFKVLHKHKVTLIKEVQYSLEKYFLENVVKGE